ncbi:MAG: SIMPL domain-containing protein, partial [Dehalococcoidia bacterium]
MHSFDRYGETAADGAPSHFISPRGKTTVRLCALFLTMTMMLSGTARVRAQTAPNPLTVTGEGSASLPPDLARLSGTVQTRATNAAEALTQNAQTLRAVIAAVEGIGVAEADISTTGLRVDPVTAQGGDSVGYRATNGIILKTTALSMVADLTQAMLAAGITNFNNVEYGLQDP